MKNEGFLRIGVDVGGTNTDAVLMEGTTLLSQAKSETSADVTAGIFDALQGVLGSIPLGRQVGAVMLGTTHFVNALIERKHLAPTAVFRICLPATRLLPPLADWPGELRQAIGGYGVMIDGGHEVDGREINTLDCEQIRRHINEIREKGVRAVALCGVFSPVDPSHERQVAVLFAKEAPEIAVSLSHEIGRMGLLERENAATLNASLIEVAHRTISGIRSALSTLGIDAPLYFSQNDGTLMDAEFASQYPVLTMASGPTNSMRGAAFLSGVQDGIVVDVGGTSTDVGALVSGFPREASVVVEIAGVRTNFRMPDVVSVALGGGSIVRRDPLRIGPDSVAFRLKSEAIVFGGSTITATDLAVAAGRVHIGSHEPTLIPDLLAREGIDQFNTAVEDVIDQLKLNAGSTPVILVGGGSVLVNDNLQGASEVLRPPHAEVANAIGAAIAQVGGQMEKVYDLGRMTRQDALADAQGEAEQKAISAGALPSTVKVVELEEIPLTYLPSSAIRVRVKAVGDLV